MYSFYGYLQDENFNPDSGVCFYIHEDFQLYAQVSYVCGKIHYFIFIILVYTKAL